MTSQLCTERSVTLQRTARGHVDMRSLVSVTMKSLMGNKENGVVVGFLVPYESVVSLIETNQLSLVWLNFWTQEVGF